MYFTVQQLFWQAAVRQPHYIPLLRPSLPRFSAGECGFQHTCGLPLQGSYLAIESAELCVKGAHMEVVDIVFGNSTDEFNIDACA